MAKISDEDLELARSNIVEVIESFGIELSSYGTEYRAICPFHSEKTPSFTITPGIGRYHCFGCGVNGNAIDFVMNLANVDFKTAAQMILGGDKIDITHKKLEKKLQPEWKPCATVPDDAPNPMNILHQKIEGKWVKLQSSDRWAYYNADGDLVGYIFRFNLPNDGKIHAPQTWCVNSDGELAWKWISFDKPRPLFGLELLAANPNASVLLVEGEKTACAARLLLKENHIPNNRLIVITWPGGVNGIKNVDFKPLLNRKICCWPDADRKINQDTKDLLPWIEQPSTAAMLNIYNILNKPDNFKIVFPPEGTDDGWDLADELPENFDILQYIKNSVPISTLLNIPAIEPEPIKERVVEKKSKFENKYFNILGYDKETYYIYQYQKGQIQAYSKGDFTDFGFISLAPLEWWESNFSKQSGGINKSAAFNWISREAESRGIYDDNKVRGRGAWRDSGKIVFHHGDYLSVDGKNMEISEWKSRYVYEKNKAFPYVSDIPLSDEEGKKILDMANMFRWSMPASGVLLSGWIALAPLCGALKWRPHVWITGGAGSGKSTCLNDFVHPLMNEMEIYAQGNSSEAGIRQKLAGDAIPILFDESESNTEKDGLRIQNILSLSRQSSSDSEAITYKGTAGGQAMDFYIQSMFCLASIQVALTKQADQERVTILNLLPKRRDNEAAAFWLEMSEKLHEITKDDELPGRLIRRSLNQLPITLKNIKTFVHAAAEKFGAQREGDQYGTLLAGAWSLVSDTLVTKREALDYIELYNWDEYRENSDSNESERALMALMGSLIRDGSLQVTVYELIQKICGISVHGIGLSEEEADVLLKRYGMRIEDNSDLILCNNHIQLNSLMEHTPFAVDFKSVLLRYPGAKKLEKAFRFNGVTSRAYSIPLGDLLNNE